MHPSSHLFATLYCCKEARIVSQGPFKKHSFDPKASNQKALITPSLCNDFNDSTFFWCKYLFSKNLPFPGEMSDPPTCDLESAQEAFPICQARQCSHSYLTGSNFRGVKTRFHMDSDMMIRQGCWRPNLGQKDFPIFLGATKYTYYKLVWPNCHHKRDGWTTRGYEAHLFFFDKTVWHYSSGQNRK